MSTNQSWWALAPAVLLSAAAFGGSSMSKSADPQSDQQINDQVAEVLQQHPDLGTGIKSHTKHGVVYLTGTVPTSLQKETAEQLAGSVSGVKKVIDNAGVEKGGG
jgi:osmotically-inducible protein OsmY